jgi:hypothetical protein
MAVFYYLISCKSQTTTEARELGKPIKLRGSVVENGLVNAYPATYASGLPFKNAGESVIFECFEKPYRNKGL